MFGFAPPYQSRLGPALQLARSAVPAAPRPMFDFGAGAGGGGGKFPSLGGQQQGGGPVSPMATQTAPGAADTASVTPVSGQPSFMPGLSSASAFDPTAAAGGGEAAAGADAAVGGADFAELLAAIFGA